MPIKQRPIIFSAPMVQAILAGRKTQTRRIVNKLNGYPNITEFGQSDTKGYDWHFRDKEKRWHDIRHDRLLELCLYGKVGDQLWVRETFSQCLNLGFDKNGNAPENLFSYSYKADGGALIGDRWKPSIHMPREASRILLEITDIRVERLQDISEADAKAEGCDDSKTDAAIEVGWYEKPVRAFRRIWESINGTDGWTANPWVWVVEFKVIQLEFAS